MNPKKLFKTLISTALVATLALTALPVTAFAANSKSSAVDPSKYLSDTFFIKNKNSGKYLDLKGGSGKNGANAIPWGFTGKSNQQWQLQKQSNGTYKIVSALSGEYALDIAGSSEKNGANVQIWKSSQTFRLVNVSGTYYKLESTVSGSAKKTIGVSGSSKKDGANVNQWSFGKTGNDQWQFERVVEISRTVYVTPTGKKYHYSDSCNGGTYTKSTLDKAKSRGLSPCSKCVN